MQLTFSTQSLRDMCEKERAAVRTLGLSAASQLRRRLADIMAADSLADLISLQVDVGTVDGIHFELALGDGVILEFSIPQMSKKQTEAPEPSKVHQIKVTGIKK